MNGYLLRFSTPSLSRKVNLINGLCTLCIMVTDRPKGQQNGY